MKWYWWIFWHFRPIRLVYFRKWIPYKNQKTRMEDSR